MALDFPNSPTNGQTYTDPGTGEQWLYDAPTNSWTSKGLVDTSGGLVFKGSLDITAAPPTGVSAGWQYSVAATGTPNAGFTGLSGTLTKGDVIMYTGTGWTVQSHRVPDATAVVKGIDTQKWTRTGTELSPATAGDSVFTTGAVKVGGTTAEPAVNINGGAPKVPLVRDSSGRLLVGTSTAQSGTRSQYSKFTVQGNNQSTNDGGQINLAIDTSAAAMNAGGGDWLGQIIFTDNGPGEYGKIGCQADAGAGTTDYPGRLVFYTTADGAATPTERMRITSTGAVLVGTKSTTTNGGDLQVSRGITFPATAVACTDVNTLDDYEEGTWTPTQGAGLTVTGTFSSVGRYTKIGNVVTLEAEVSATSVAAAANGIICGGAPFAPAGGGRAHGVAVNIVVTGTEVMLNGANNSVYACEALAATAKIYITITYHVS